MSKPCLPAHWETFKIHYRYRETVYHINIAQVPAGDGANRARTRVTVDRVEQTDSVSIPLVDDHIEHAGEVSVLAE